MNKNTFLDRCLHVPYADGGSEWTGADCWGLVELYYKYVLDIDLQDRGDIDPGHEGLQRGFDAAEHWQKIEKPEQHCLVIMKAKGLLAGHVGIFIDGHVLHTDEKTGCTYEPISDRFIRTTTTCYLKHDSINS